MVSTFGDLIARALRGSGVVGVGQTALAEDTNDALALLRQIIAQWRTQRWLVYAEVDTGIPSTGAVSYTVGPGGDFDIVRPSKIQYAFFRQSNASPANPVDYPLLALESREDYSRIGLKNLSSFPQYYFYDSAYPIGSIYFWPVPQNLYELHIGTRVVLEDIASLATPNTLPPEYEAALYWNLCAELRPNYQMQPDPTVVAKAKSSLQVIRMTNAQIPQLVMPPGLGFGGHYNIYSDQNTN